MLYQWPHLKMCETCRHCSLFFLVPVGVNDDAATIPNRIGRSGDIVVIQFFAAPLVSSWAHQTPPMAAPEHVRHADTVACSSLSLLVSKMMLQQFQTG